MSSSVATYILTGKPDSSETGRVWNYFSDPLFDRNLVVVNEPDAKMLTYSQNSLEFYRIKKALEDAAQNHPNDTILLVKDTSISNKSPEAIAKFVKDTLPMANGYANNGWDLFYLTKWQDRCDLFQHKGMVDDMGISESFAPNGFQALMITPAARDMLLGKMPLKNGSMFQMQNNFSDTLHSYIQNKQLKPYVSTPNLFNFDPALAKNGADGMKGQECADIQNYQQVAGTSNWVWFILILIIVLILIAVAASKKR
jgi:hypothetical protein